MNLSDNISQTLKKKSAFLAVFIKYYVPRLQTVQHKNQRYHYYIVLQYHQLHAQRVKFICTCTMQCLSSSPKSVDIPRSRISLSDYFSRAPDFLCHSFQLYKQLGFQHVICPSGKNCQKFDLILKLTLYSVTCDYSVSQGNAVVTYDPVPIQRNAVVDIV